MRILSAIIVLIGLATLLWFLTTKPIEVSREDQISQLKNVIKSGDQPSHVQTLRQGDIAGAWWGGVLRRVDDISFWNAVAVSLAAFLMYRGWTRASRHPAFLLTRIRPIPFTAIWLAVAAPLVFAYLLSVYKNQGTFWWHTREGADATIALLQMSEGLINVLVIVAASALLPMGIYLVKLIELGLGAAQPGDDCDSLLSVCAALAGIVLAPLSSLLLASLSWKLIRWVLEAAFTVDFGYRGLNWLWAGVFLVAVLSQFFILGYYAWRKLGPYVCPTISIWGATILTVAGAILSFPALLLFLSIKAEWKEKSPCAP